MVVGRTRGVWFFLLWGSGSVIRSTGSYHHSISGGGRIIKDAEYKIGVRLRDSDNEDCWCLSGGELKITTGSVWSELG